MKEVRKMQNEVFDQFKEVIEKVQELRIIVSDIEMKIDNDSTEGIKEDFKEVYQIVDDFSELEKEIYYKYLI